MSNDNNYYLQLRQKVKRQSNTIKYKMVIIVRKDLNMSIGKTAAQVGHAVLNAYKQALLTRTETVNHWETSGQAKIVLGIQGIDELLQLKGLADSLSIPNAIITDAGYTELLPNTITCMAIGPGVSSEIDQISGKLSLL